MVDRSMLDRDDLISGRDALHRLDEAVQASRDAFDASARSADAHRERRARLAQLRADGYHELARLRLDVLKAGADDRLTAAEARANALLDQHAAFAADLDARLASAAAALQAAETARREGEQAVDAALEAYESKVEAVEASLQTDAGYLALVQAYEEARAVGVRAAQKLELAKTDRIQKGAPYEADPLFAYLWDRKFRTSAYKAEGLTRMLDGWVARVCGYDAAWMNYARLVELPDRLAEHLARMKLEEAEAEAAIERFETEKLSSEGAGALSDALGVARERLKALDETLAAAEQAHSRLREQQEQAATGRSGPYEEACKVIEEGLRAASFPDLKVLAAQTVSLDDDRIVEALVKLRTEELQMEVNGRAVDALPVRRRGSVEALESVRRRFKSAGLDSPYVSLLGAAFSAALAAYGRDNDVEADKMWRALTATVREAPRRDDHYFGGRKRRDTIGLPDDLDDLGGIAGVVIGEVIREVSRGGMRGRWGGGGPWGGGGMGGGSSGPRIGGGSRGGGRIGGGGFKTGGRSGGGGFKTGGRF